MFLGDSYLGYLNLRLAIGFFIVEEEDEGFPDVINLGFYFKGR